MKRTLYTILLLMLSIEIFAQNYPHECTETEIPVSKRERYFSEVRQFLNNYYMQILDLNNNVVQDGFIESNFADRQSVSFSSEFVPDINNLSWLSPKQYLLELVRTTSGYDNDELYFQVDNISCNKIIMKTSVSCYVPATYDLTLSCNDKILFKRRCMAYCLFDNIMNYLDVKIMQVEPLHDIIAFESQMNTVRSNMTPTEPVVDIQHKSSFSVIEENASNGDKEAQLELAIGHFTRQEYNEAVTWFKQAADLGHAEAQYYLANCYQAGLGVSMSKIEAFQWYTKAAEQGYVKAQLTLAQQYYKSKNYELAYSYFQQVGEKAEVAAFFIAWMNEHGQGIPQNLMVAMQWYEKCKGYRDSHQRIMNIKKKYFTNHEYVDLGLSVKWASCNIGASQPEYLGDLFAWGETKSKEKYEKENSLTYGKDISQTFNHEVHDAARINWRGGWRMPSETEFKELISECEWDWTTVNDVKGYKVTGPNGNSIFLPTNNKNNLFVTTGTAYWTSTQKNKKTAIGFYFTKFAHKANRTGLPIYKYAAGTVRAVIE